MTVAAPPVTVDPADLKAMEGQEATTRLPTITEAVELTVSVELVDRGHRVGEVGEGTMGAGEAPGREAEAGRATRAGLSASTLKPPTRDTALCRY